MPSWFRLGRSNTEQDAATHKALLREIAEEQSRTRAAVSQLAESLAASSARAEEDREAIRKLSRAVGRTALRVESIEKAVATQSPVATTETPSIGDLLDALDLLDRGIEASTARAPAEITDGFRGVRVRLEGHLKTLGLTRHRPTGVPPDPALFRVAGVTPHSALPEGAIATVTRAAVTRGAALVREGEVITARRAPSEDHTPAGADPS